MSNPILRCRLPAAFCPVGLLLSSASGIAAQLHHELIFATRTWYLVCFTSILRDL